jgi:putative MATE family efflux protein
MKKYFKSFLHKQILRLALPAIAGLSSQMIVSLVDTAMIGRLNEAKYALAAMGIGVMATWALISFFSSLSTGTHVLVARKFGNTDYRGCGEVMNISLVLSLMVGLVVGFLGVSFAYTISHFFAADFTVGDLAGDFLHYRFMGIPFFLLTVSYRGFFFGIGKTKIFMYSGILVNVLNIIFSYTFIYGAFGAPQMGLAGGGLGATLATICDSLFYFFVTMRKDYRRKFYYFRHFKFDTKILKAILKISLPVSFQNVLILIGFLSFISITGLIGTLEQAASQTVVSSLFISFMPCFGFGIAAQTLVGNNLGSGKFKLAKVYGFETTRIATYYTLALGIIFILFPQLILYLVTTNNAVIETAVPILRIAGFAQIFYATGIVLANGLQAAGESIFVMAAEVITNWLIFIALSYYLGVYLEFGLIGAWFALPFYIICYSLAVYLKFRFGKWQTEVG